MRFPTTASLFLAPTAVLGFQAATTTTTPASFPQHHFGSSRPVSFVSRSNNAALYASSLESSSSSSSSSDVEELFPTPAALSRNDNDDDDEDCPVVVPTTTLTDIHGKALPSSATSSFLYLKSVIPGLTLCGAMGLVITAALAPFSSPAAQGAKLVFAGAVAGILSRTCCAPIEMVSTVMMCRGKEACGSMMSELSTTWQMEGLRGMFKGNGANCLKVAPSRGTQFLVYEFLKRQMVVAGFGVVASSGSLHAGARLIAGGLAGMVAASIVYPLEVVKTMLTLYPEECGGTVPGAVRKVFKAGGIAGLYRGLGPTLVAMFPYVGVEFMVYETLKKKWELTMGPVGTAILLVFGALSGAAAQASAHPLDVIRRRMQMTKKYPNMFTGLYRVQKEEGFSALFNGLGPACLEKIPSTAIGYFIYEAMKQALKVTSV